MCFPPANRSARARSDSGLAFWFAVSNPQDSWVTMETSVRVKSDVRLAVVATLFVACSLTNDLEDLENVGDASAAGGAGGSGGNKTDAAPDGKTSLDAEASVDAPADTKTDTNDGASIDAPADSPPPTYRDEVLADAPLFYWRLDEPVGPTATDLSGNGNDGTFVGSVVYERPGALVGDSNGAVELTGGHIDAGDVGDFAGQTAFTFEIWVTFKGAALDYTRIATKETSLTMRNGWTIMLRDPAMPRIAFERWLDGSTDAVAPVKTLPTTEFAHLVAVYDGVTMKLYVDAVEIGSTLSSKSLLDTTASLRIGGYSDTANKLAGVIDEVALYASPLPASRIKAHYDRALSPGG